MFSIQTLETRWFFPGTIPPEAEAWFATLGDVLSLPPRTDLYLLGTGEAMGIKLREGRVELKKRTGQHGEMFFGHGVCGEVEGWVKWSFDVENDLLRNLWADAHWTAVEKQRQILYYTLDAGGHVRPAAPGIQPETGSGLELTALRVNGADWWTVGAEVFGPQDVLPGFLSGIIQQAVQISSTIAFIINHSRSYPSWLMIDL